MGKHWKKSDYIETGTECFGVVYASEGYCGKCYADMIKWDGGHIRHYRSHQVARSLRLWSGKE